MGPQAPVGPDVSVSGGMAKSEAAGRVDFIIQEIEPPPLIRGKPDQIAFPATLSLEEPISNWLVALTAT